MCAEFSPIQELFGEEIRHCAAPFSHARADTFTQLETLPYHDLGGPGLERLCFELLLSMGYETRFFGRSGQAQHGIDIVAEKDGRTHVYQCKNIGQVPTSKELFEYLDKFESEWLGNAKLPRPERFVICCPQPLRDSGTDSEWMVAKEEFKTRTDIEVGYWHRDLLDGWLTRCPDIVADLFSDRHAEAFCDIDNWKPSLFIPLREGASGDLRLRRYFEYRRAGRLYVEHVYEQKILEALDGFPVILVRGLPGTGKTLSSLAVAESFRQGNWRTYFLDVGDDEFTKTQMRDGIKRRLSRPSIFVLENCHENFGAVGDALRDLTPEMESGRARAICLTRRVPGSQESRSDDSDFALEIEAQGATVDFENDDELLRRMVEFWKPEFHGLSDKRLAKLGAMCGRNLLFLDEAVSLIESAVEIDTISPSEMYDRVRRAFFDHKTGDDLAATRRLAALAQFDLRPRADVLALPEGERLGVSSLCVRAGHPPRWHFLHSSAAELVLHALWAGMGVSDQENVAYEAAKDIVSYFRDVQADDKRPSATPESLETELLSVVENRLMLAGEDGESRLKAVVLGSGPVLDLLPKLEALPTFARTMSICAVVANEAGSDSAEVYARRLRLVVENALESADQQRLLHVLPFLGAFLMTLKVVAPAEYIVLTERLNASRLLDLIEAYGTLYELFKIVEQASPELVRGLMEALDEARLAQMCSGIEPRLTT